jgi:hypothetical protein
MLEEAIRVYLGSDPSPTQASAVQTQVSAV